MYAYTLNCYPWGLRIEEDFWGNYSTDLFVAEASVQSSGVVFCKDKNGKVIRVLGSNSYYALSPATADDHYCIPMPQDLLDKARRYEAERTLKELEAEL